MNTTVILTISLPGLEHTHDDLKDNWDPAASFDFNSNDMDPMPQQNDDNKWEAIRFFTCMIRIKFAPYFVLYIIIYLLILL